MNIIFDLDGTLIDSLPGIAWSVSEALRATGLPPISTDLRALIGPPVRHILATISGLPESGTLDRLERRFRLSYDTEGWRRTVCQPGVPDMLWSLLTTGVDLWVVTNKPAFATGRILGSLKIGGFFREVACRDSLTPPFASKAELLTDLLSRRGLDRTRCLMVGDTAEDAHAAEAAKIACAVVSHGYGSGVVPESCFRIENWRELEEMICGFGQTNGHGIPPGVLSSPDAVAMTNEVTER